MYQDKNKLNRIWFKNKRINVGFNPRTGICSLCHKQGLTDIHHVQYHELEPLKDTIELCDSCHNRQRHKDMSERFCLECGSTETYLRKENWFMWYKYKNGWICKNCYKKLWKQKKTNR